MASDSDESGSWLSSDQILKAISSLAASALYIDDFIPKRFRNYFSSSFSRFYSRFLDSSLTVVIDEFQGLTHNHMFEASNVYLGTKISNYIQRIKVNKPQKEEEDDQLAVTVDEDQVIIDSHGGIKFQWILLEGNKTTTQLYGAMIGNHRIQPRRHLELSFHKKNKDYALRVYLPYILRKAKEVKEETRVMRLHTVDYNSTHHWSSVVMNHPATFQTMAMDPDTKKELIEDLDRFVKRKDYYRRVGKAWKRGYLFYGPPGTGKSSLVAAMANYLKFDVYDLDLREVKCNLDLRRLLLGSATRSILVIEDIDCNLGLLMNRADDSITNDAAATTTTTTTHEDGKITLSALLNLIDGLWSSCGDERIIVFTTNHKNRLDPALLRPGRMDVQVEMSYCTFSGFKILSFTYLSIEENSLFPVIQELLTKVKATPAEIAGELMKSEDADTALLSLIQFLKDKEIIRSQ